MAAPQSNTSSVQRQRVKLSCLIDRGTGHVTMDYIEEQSEERAIHVMDDDNATLLVHRIRPEVIYRKQQDNKAISWRDPEQHSTEFTLSFEDTVECCYMWDQIFNNRRNLNFNSVASEKQVKLLEQEVENRKEEIRWACSRLRQIFPSIAIRGPEATLAEMIGDVKDIAYRRRNRLYRRED